MKGKIFSMGTKPKYKVVQLFAPNDPLPRFVEACRIDKEPMWKLTWRHRDQLNSKLANWFRQLDEKNQEPIEKCLLGRNVSLDEKCARAVAQFRLQEISMMSGSWPRYPDFIVNEIVPRGRGHKRSIWANGVRFESVTSAAKACGITRRAVYDRLRHADWHWA
jgi:hypothetical protein